MRPSRHMPDSGICAGSDKCTTFVVPLHISIVYALASPHDDHVDALPTDPENAALDLLVDAAEAATGSAAFRAVLQDLAGALHAERALANLAWVDARLVAAAVSFDACTAADLAGSLRRRAAAVRAGRGPRCADPAGNAGAPDVAANVLKPM